LRLSLLLGASRLGCLAVRVEHRAAWLAVLRHEELEVDVTTLTLGIASGGVLLKHLLEFAVLQFDRPR